MDFVGSVTLLTLIFNYSTRAVKQMAFSFLAGQKNTRKRQNTTPADDNGNGGVSAASVSSSSSFALDLSAPASCELTPSQKLHKTVVELIPRSLADHAIAQFCDAFRKVPRIAAQIAAKQSSLNALQSLADKGEKPKSLPKLASPSLPLAVFSEDDRKIAAGQLASIAKAASEEQFKIVRVWREREIALLHAQITDLCSETSRKVLEQLLAAAQSEKATKAALKGKVAEGKSGEGKEGKEDKGNGAGSAAAAAPAPVPMSLGDDAAAQAGLPSWAANTATVIATLHNEWSESVTQALLLAVARAKAAAQSDADKKSKAEEKRQKEAKVAADSALDAASFGRAPLYDSDRGAHSAGHQSSAKSGDSKRSGQQQQSNGHSSRGQSSGGKSGSKNSKGKGKNNSSKGQHSGQGKQQSKGKDRGRGRGSSSTKRGSSKRGGRGKSRVRSRGRGRGSWKRGRGRGSFKH